MGSRVGEVRWMELAFWVVEGGGGGFLFRMS